MNVPALLQVAGFALGVAGVFLVAGIGCALIAACAALLVVGVALEREQVSGLQAELEQAVDALRRGGG